MDDPRVQTEETLLEENLYSPLPAASWEDMISRRRIKIQFTDLWIFTRLLKAKW